MANKIDHERSGNAVIPVTDSLAPAGNEGTGMVQHGPAESRDGSLVHDRNNPADPQSVNNGSRLA